MYSARKFRRSICVLLAVLLVAIQQLGFAHALTHLGKPAPQKTSRNDTQHPAEKVCIECIAFAQLGSGLTSHVFHAPPPAPNIAVADTSVSDFAPAFFSHFLSRAPPSSV